MTDGNKWAAAPHFMEVKESYRVLELEIGASRASVDAAFCRLIEHWHPDRVPPGDTDAANEAQRMVKAINEAYQTLTKIAPDSAAPSNSSPASAAPIAVVKAKPKLPPLVGGQPSLSGTPPPKPPPPPETWAARSTTPAITPPPTVLSAPPPPPSSTKSLPPLPPPVTPPAQPPPPPPARIPTAAPHSAPATSAAEVPSTPPTALSEFRSVVTEFYDSLFPRGTPRRRFGPIVSFAAILLLLLLVKCAFPSTKSSKSNLPPDPTTIGRLVVKSNLATTTVEATRLPGADGVTNASVTGSDEGAAEQILSNLPPGKYVITARSTGWKEIKQEMQVDAGRTTDVSVIFKGGSLRLDSDPAGATVRFGSTVLGVTPLVAPELPPGDCQLSLKYSTWPPTSYVAKITEGTESTGSVRLPHGKLTIESFPSGVTIQLAGTTVGKTPLTLEQVPAGPKKIKLQSKDFPPLELSIVVEDRGEVKVNPEMSFAFPVLDPAALLRSIWVPDNEDRISPANDGVTGPFQSRNGIVKNLNRKRLTEVWLTKRYRFTGVIKAYDPGSGQIEFVEQSSQLAKYRVIARLTAAAHDDQSLTAQLVKGATFGVYGTLSATEEPRWPFKAITFEITTAQALR